MKISLLCLFTSFFSNLLIRQLRQKRAFIYSKENKPSENKMIKYESETHVYELFQNYKYMQSMQMS